MTRHDPVSVVQRQLDAYNARDLDRFAACFAEGITIYRLPALQPAITGQQQFRELYRQRFAATNLHAEILSRIVMGNKVIDHERIVGIREVPIEAVAVYEVASGIITTVWFFYPQ